MERRVHEPRVHCLHCGYDLSGIGTGLCPECGQTTSGFDAVVSKRRQALVDRMESARWCIIGWCAAVIFIDGLGAGVLSRDWIAVLNVWLVLAVLTVGSVAAVLPGLWVVPHSDRRVVFAVWVRWIWVPQLLWIVLGPEAVVVALVAWIEVSVGKSAEGLTQAVSVFGVVLWLLIVGISPLAYKEEREGMLDDLGLAGRLMQLGAIGVFLLAFLTSSVGGAFILHELTNLAGM